MDDEITCIAFRYDYLETDDQRPYVVAYNYFDEHFKGVYGVENHNKYGEEIKKHFHFHFLYTGDEKQSRKFVEKVRKRIQRSNTDRGKGYYSLTIVKPDDIDRWLRYPLKQYESFELAKTDQEVLPLEYDLFLQWTLANEEYNRDKAFLSCRRERADRRQTTYELILERAIERFGTLDNRKSAPDNGKSAPVTQEQLFKLILEYYDDNGLPYERLKIRSIVDTLSIKYGLMSPLQYFDIVMK